MIRLAVRVRREHAEVVLAELLELAPNGVEETDDGDVVEYAVYGAPGELPGAARPCAPPPGEAFVEVVTEEVLRRLVRRLEALPRPVLVGERLHVRPPWTDPLGRDGVEEIVIDPGQAFGTGSHATTRMCLELLLRLRARRVVRRPGLRERRPGDLGRAARLVAGDGGGLRGGQRGGDARQRRGQRRRGRGLAGRPAPRGGARGGHGHGEPPAAAAARAAAAHGRIAAARPDRQRPAARGGRRGRGRLRRRSAWPSATAASRATGRLCFCRELDTVAVATWLVRADGRA